jgi:zinc transporter, ZIP family
MGAIQRRSQGKDDVNLKSVLEVTNGNGGKANADKSHRQATPTPTWVYVLLVAFAIITVVTCPRPFQPHGEPTVHHVFFYGWLTAISTGLGVLPFIFHVTNVASYWVGISNGESKSIYMLL